jgi:8-oxo-dGTP diphosphatase
VSTGYRRPVAHPIISLVDAVRPHDAREADDLAEFRRWITSGAPLYRTVPPDVPPQHLVVYFLPYDRRLGRVLLVDHRKAGLWLPPGGHVDPGEDPRDTVVREAAEELGLRAVFEPGLGQPFFATVTRTVGPGGHLDATLWFILQSTVDGPLHPDPGEFRGIGWFGLDEVQGQGFDPELPRCVAKLGNGS